jgi:hypothetical protein
MGFIGGGAILKHGGEVQGTATAASLWATGAIGVAVALAELRRGADDLRLHRADALRPQPPEANDRGG